MASYSDAGSAPLANTGQIKLHGEAAFAAMRKAGRLAAQTLDMLVDHVRPGVATAALDALAFTYIRDHGAAPAPLYYRGFPKAICTSVNHVVCHGIPGSRVLRTGEIVNIDVTVVVEGWHGDSSRMYPVGEAPRKASRLMAVTYEALMLGIGVARPGRTLGDIGHVIERHAVKNRCSVVREFCGHGLGRLFHDAPNVLHYGRPGEGAVLREGMIFTIEPMINLGKPEVKILADGWTAVTRDRSLSAQFEHSIGITRDGCEIFTTSPMGLDCPPYARCAPVASPGEAAS